MVGRKRKTVLYKGEEWDAFKLMKFGRWKNDGWPRELLRFVRKGEMTMKEVLEKAKNRRAYTSRRNFKYRRIEKLADGTTIEKIYKLADVVAATGLTHQSAWMRLKQTADGIRDPDKLLEPKGVHGRKRKPAKIPDGKLSFIPIGMTPEREEKRKLLERFNQGEITQNEYLRLA